MKVWLPSVRARSGSDVYVERLAKLLESVGCEPLVSWFPHWQELLPWASRIAKHPAAIDVIHANSWHGFVFAGCGVPLVTTVHHCVAGLGYPQWKTRLQSLYHDHWIGPFEKRSIDVSSAVVAVSRSTEQELTRHHSIHGIHVIENWVETDTFLPRSVAREGAPKVLFVGNLSRRKGGDLLPALRTELSPQIELHVVGGRRGHGLRHPVSEPGIERWSGLDLKDLVELYQQIDVLVCLSRHEGFGYTALEAMACGKPVVAFDVPGLRDVVANGHTGILVPPGDVRAVAMACHELIDKPARANGMGKAGRQLATGRFSAERAASAYLAVYRTVCSASIGSVL